MPKSSTMKSDIFARNQYLKAKKETPDVPKANYMKPRPRVANTMDICTWFTQLAKTEGWPVVDSERVDRCKTNEFRAGLSNDLTPIDGLKTFGSTMLHEVRVPVLAVWPPASLAVLWVPLTMTAHS